MIIIHFPKTLGGVSFEKAGKLCGERKPIFFDKTQIAASLAICLIHTSLFPKRTTKGDSPLETPKLYFNFSSYSIPKTSLRYFVPISVSLNFWIFPLPVIGNSFRNIKNCGHLYFEIFPRQYSITSSSVRVSPS